MIPTAFVALERLPLTANGKVDRRALPKPEAVERVAEYEGPRTATEERLCAIWGELLGLPQVGVRANFFELGGHSLLATQVVSRVCGEFEVELALKEVFEHPTVEALARRVEEAGGKMEESGVAGPALRRLAPGEPSALSFAQQRLWFLDQLEPGSAAYNVPAALRLTGHLDVAALERTLNEILRRHESLRTTFAQVDGEPVQVIAPFAWRELPVTDLSELSADERDAAARRLVEAEQQRPFDLTAGPVSRGALLRLGKEEHVLLVTMHHIVSDGWSVGVFVRELTSLYAAYTRGEESPLSELPIQYADYAAWQREHLSGKRLDAQLTYWKEQLSGAPALLTLPTDRPRPAVQRSRGATASITLPAELVADLRRLGQAHGCTLFMTLLAGWQALLSRYSGQDDIVVGTPVAGRTRRETEDLIGFFVNTLALRTDLSGDPSFEELLRRARETTLGAYAHQDVPFERLVEELAPERSLSHQPIFQVMFTFRNAPRERMNLEGVTLTPMNVGTRTSQFDLTLGVAESPDKAIATLEYSTDLFDVPSAERMLSHYRRMLEEIIKDRSAPLSALPLVAEDERRKVLYEWNDTAHEFSPRPVHRLFEEQAARSPHALAVEQGEERLTYGELNARAGRLALALRERGIRQESRVGVCVGRSPWMLVALLGVLKAGAAYVPLDPEYPAERLAYMIDDAGITLVLTEPGTTEKLPEGIASVAVESLAASATAEGQDCPDLPVNADNTAYVIYTSGSTGTPKGVLIQHGSLLNYTAAAVQEFELRPGDKVLQFSSISFDAAAEEIYPTLTAGATLVLRDERMLDSSRTFLEKTLERGITVLDLPTAYWHHLTHDLAATPLTLPASLRLVIIGGEEALPERLAEWHRVAGGRVRLLNTYGPTETAIVATTCELAPPEAGGALPRAYIGAPVRNVRTYVLDARLQPTPVGVPGELYIGGAGVARGYLNRPSLTAERFVPNPFGESPGERLYRTGDGARYIHDGRLEFLGRLDQQVKVRGFRVELGEIEAALRAHPSVRESIVLAGEAAPGGLQLVAYLLRESQHVAPSSAELRSFLQQRVPGYMIPAAFVVLDEWPLLPNGKIDRRALPAPETPSAAAEPTGARTPFEEIIAGIWREVLRREAIGVHDSFFELGGHSLLATQVVSRVRESIGMDIPLKALFEHTTVTALAAHVEGLLAAGETLAPAPPITRAPRDGHMPLSFAQQRLWFIDRLEPGSSVYNIPAALRLTGRLDVNALERAFGEMVRRHDSLRTTFAEAGGVPVQVLAEQAATELPVLDLRDAPGGAETEARRLATEEARRPFDLAQGPLLRVVLLRLGEEEHILLATMHHIISDGWSVGVLVRELTALYAAYTRGEESPLSELPIQYADYARWQKEHLSGERLDAQIGYWKEQLTGAPALLALPTDRPRPAVQSYRGATHPFSLAPDLAARLHELSRAHGCTLFMTLLAGWQTLLSRYSGQEDVVVGTPIAGRTQRETEGLIGFFVNTLALRTDVSGNPSFAELLRRVRETTLGAYAHQDVPFEKLVEELAPDRDMSRSPLFQVMFVLQNAPREALQLEGLTLRGVENAGETAKFELTLGLEERRGEIVGGVDYNRDLYEAKTVARMVEGYERVLRAMVEDAEQRVLHIELVSEEERRQIVAQWNETGREYGGAETVQEMFAEQAERNGEAVAVVYEGMEVSYAELNRRANQLAHYLHAQGVKADDVVGVLMQRSVEMVVALLGILKAGGAYLPLDPAYPRERLSFMVGDARLRWLISHQPAEAALAELLPNAAPLKLLLLDAEWAAVASQPSTAPGVRPAPDNLAYVIYTSGSTGRPKGVMISHRAISNHMRWMQASFPLGTGDAVLQKTPFSFDASVWEFYAPLLAGARLVVARPGGHQEAAYLVEVMEREGVTRLQVVPTLLRMLVSEPGIERCERLREVFSGGEVLTRELAERFLKTSGEGRLYNLYGPTEATIDATWQEVERDKVEAGEEVGIGRAIANTQLYVLDGEMAVAPIGVVGELYIGGAGLGRGYLNRPELTAEKFVPNPYSTSGGERLYRTGDMVRWREDGELAYVGRVDAQVKVRGFRIELGEIESALLTHAGIGEVAVVARESADGSPHLVAYYVIAAGTTRVGVAELRAHLAERLPEHMMPSYFMRMEALPLTPNGKLDRRALPAPEAASGREYVAPRSGSEEAMCAIWREVLRVEQAGVHDNFFELGGHSLLATQVVSRVREVFAIELPLRRLFESPTVAGLASVLDEMAAEPSAQGAAPSLSIVSGEREDYPPLSFAQQRLWFLDRLEPGSSAYNVPAALRLTGHLDIVALKRTLNEVVRRHDSLRTTFAEAGGVPVQVIADELVVEVPFIDLSGVPGDAASEARRIATEEGQRPFDLARGPLLRVLLLRLAEEEHVLLTMMHHIISDGWSVGVLVRELTALYAAYTRGEESPLSELPVQYADYARWQRDHLSGERLDAQIGYWKERLSGAPALLALPSDHPRPVVQGYGGAGTPIQLHESLVIDLRRLGQAHGCTLFMTLLAAWQALLSRYSGQEDVVVGTPIAGRTRRETEDLIGFFVNTLVLRTDLSGDPSFEELLRRARETTLGAYAHQDVPFERLVEELAPERSLSHQPVFQVMFVLGNAPRERMALGDVAVGGFAVSGDASEKFDMTLALNEAADGAIGGELSYNTGLFEAATAEQMAAHYVALLAGAVARPAEPVSAVPLLDEEEYGRQEAEWNATQSGWPRGQTIPKLFEAQAEATPEAVALIDGEARIGYAELNRRADALARRLRSLGVGIESRVGIFTSRSTEMVVALLGVLKAGAAYVPLDHTYPRERLAFMMSDAGLSLVLTQESVRASLPECECAVLLLDGDHAAPEVEAGAGGDAREALSENLAYIIYTSGSTGLPKGVAITHGSAAILVEWMRRLFTPEQLSGVLASTSICFDLSVFELFGTLCCGGSVILAENALALHALPAAAEVTLVNTVPSVMAELLRSGSLPEEVRVVNLAGEPLSLSLAQRVWEEPGVTHLYNLYGPTEDTTYSTWAAVGAQDTRAPVIGRPLPDTRAYILDTKLRPTPVGVAGELYLAGEGLARGYHGRPGLTAERFIPDPFSVEPGGRLYRTGDLARRLTNGDIDLLGRADYQVKIRGFRIELGEVEAAVASHPAVSEAVVLAVESQGSLRLVCYYTTRDGSEATAQELRAHIERRLPGYMVPSAFTELRALPLTSNGKVDRRALAALEVEPSAGRSTYEPPQTPVEELLCSIWEEVLGVEQVGVRDNFFELGGHSLLATQVISRCRELLECDVPLRTLFESPTVAELAVALLALSGEDDEEEVADNDVEDSYVAP
jgi:amino acid adenylation domain-containing protein